MPIVQAEGSTGRSSFDAVMAAREQVNPWKRDAPSSDVGQETDERPQPKRVGLSVRPVSCVGPALRRRAQVKNELENVKCFRCGKLGHYAANCTQKGKKKVKRGPRPFSF